MLSKKDRIMQGKTNAHSNIRLTTHLFAAFFFFSLITNYAFTQDNWELVKDEEQIKVYMNKGRQDKKLTHVRASSETDKGSLRDYYTLMKDVDSYMSWMHGIKNIELLEKQKENEFTYYMLSDFPWPAKDRDIVISTKVYYKKDKGLVYTDSKKKANVIPEKEGIQRVEDMNASWSFEKIGHETIKIIYEGKIHSSIDLPDWLKKHVAYIGPFNTIKNIKEEIGRKN